MKVTEFALKVTEQEGLKKGVSIAQISEILKVTNSLLDGQLYSMIKNHENEMKSDKKMTGRAIVNKEKNAKVKPTSKNLVNKSKTSKNGTNNSSKRKS